jgi:hypothetical protein
MALLSSDARVTPDEVKEIIETTLDDGALSACINAANAMIAASSTMTTNLSASTLIQIELWLSGHFVTVAEPRIQLEKIDNVTAQYVVPYGVGLADTAHGKMALALDTTGSLADSAFARKQATFDVL